MSDPIKLDRPSQQISVKDSTTIGPFYRAYAIGVGLAAFILLLLCILTKCSTPIVIGLIVAMVMLVLGMIRPEKFDSAMKTLADWLPMFKFKKD